MPQRACFATIFSQADDPYCADASLAHDDSVNRGFEMDALIRKAMSETRPEEN